MGCTLSTPDNVELPVVRYPVGESRATSRAVPSPYLAPGMASMGHIYRVQGVGAGRQDTSWERGLGMGTEQYSPRGGDRAACPLHSLFTSLTVPHLSHPTNTLTQPQNTVQQLILSKTP